MVGAGIFTAFAAQNTLADTELRWGHVYESQSPCHQWAEWAADTFEERTNGRYSIEVFPASTLGKQVDLAEGLGTEDIMYDEQFFAGRR